MKEEKIIRLPRSGPMPNQSVDQWLKAQQRAENAALERGRWKLPKGKKKGA